MRLWRLSQQRTSSSLWVLEQNLHTYRCLWWYGWRSRTSLPVSFRSLIRPLSLRAEKSKVWKQSPRGSVAEVPGLPEPAQRAEDSGGTVRLAPVFF